MVRNLVQRSGEIMDVDGSSVSFSAIMWALGSLGFHPGQDYMRKYLRAVRSRRILDTRDSQVRARPPPSLTC
jgi:hypothetical protein